MNATVKHGGKTATFLDCEQGDCIQGHLLQGHWYEMALLETLEALGATGSYLDIGAYVGTFSVFAGMFCPARYIVSFEPQKAIFETLKANMHENGLHNFQAINVALGSKAGWGRMTTDKTNQGGAKLTTGLEVPIIPLDAFTYNDVSVIKIDAEGSELDIIKGGRNTIAKAEFLFLETWPEKTCAAYGIPYNEPEINTILKDLGYVRQCELPGDTFFYRRKA